ncbi:MAG TPA: tetratricopeptide repeat protein, partial [Flavobacteriales bacterium]|nr:tetratricopeptide repeat protein [Flavobacteriales bacterium]
PFALLVGGYFALRSAIVNVPTKQLTEVMDAPYLLATTSEHIGSILFTLLIYLKLLVWPHPLSFDYGYHQIPYRDLSDPGVWVAIVVLALLAFVALRGLVRRDMLGWCVLFFGATLSLVANIFVNVGAPLGERFLFQASVPFVIAVAECMRRVLMRSGEVQPAARAATAVALAGVLVLGTVGTVTRNTDWHSGDELFLHDVNVVPNSARANTYAGSAEIRKTDAMNDPKERRATLQRAITYLRRSEEIKKDFLLAHLNMGVALVRLDSLDAAEQAWERARAINPDDAKLRDYDAYVYSVHFKRGMDLGTAGNYPASLVELQKAQKYGPNKAEVWYNLGGAYFSLKDTARAKECWVRTLQLDPNVQQAKNALASLNVKPAAQARP